MILKTWLVLVTCVCRFVRHALGGPTVAEHDKLKKDLVELQFKHDLLLSQHEECCRQVYSASFQISTNFQNREWISLWRFVVGQVLCHSYNREHEDTSSWYHYKSHTQENLFVLVTFSLASGLLYWVIPAMFCMELVYSSWIEVMFPNLIIGFQSMYVRYSTMSWLYWMILSSVYVLQLQLLQPPMEDAASPSPSAPPPNPWSGWIFILVNSHNQYRSFQ